MWLFALLVGVPIIEIALFIQVGGFLGLWPTLGIVVLTAIIGANLLRLQGRGALIDLQSSLGGRGDPARALAHGAMILVAGVLLLTPGFFTDAVGFALLLPPVRAALILWGARRMAGRVNAEIRMTGFSAGPGPGPEPRPEPRPGPRSGPRQTPRDPGGEVIDGEFTELRDDGPAVGDAPRSPKARPSGWTRPD